MRRLIVQEFVTVDGYVAAADGALDFTPGPGGPTPADPQLERDQLRFLDDVDTMLLGRATYQMFADYWPTPKSAGEPIADRLNALARVVVSRTLDRAPWGAHGEATVVRDGAAAVAALKRGPGRGIVLWGSPTLVQALFGAGLVDECRLWVCPSVLGTGKALFAAAGGRRHMRLLDTTSYASGVVQLRYAPSGVPA